MKIKSLKANLTLVTLGGVDYLFSYETLVAGFDLSCVSPEENGYWFVGESYSATTTRHIKFWLENLYTSPKTVKVSKGAASMAQEALV